MKRHFGGSDAENGFGEWGGYMGAKIAKLEEQYAEDAAKNPYKQSNLFAGISIFVNGLTDPSADELKRIMMAHGGVYHTYQKSSTMFIIASNLPDVKIRQLTTAKIISPQWVVDCLKEKRILDYSRYLLYTNSKTSQPKIQFRKTTDKNETNISSPMKASGLLANETPGLDLNTSITVGLDMLNNMLKDESVDFLDDKPVDVTNSRTNKTGIEKSNAGTARTAVDPNFLSEFYNNSRLHHIATLGAGFKDYVSRLREQHDGQFLARDKMKMDHAEIPSKSSFWRGNKIIMHIDMDCFFVSVGLRNRPHLRGQPVAVTHSKGSNANQIKQKAGADRQKEMELYARRQNDKFKIKSGINCDTADKSEFYNEDVNNDSIIDTTTSLSEIASCSYEARRMGVKNGMFVGAALKLCPQLKTIPYDFDGYKEVARLLYDTIIQYTLDVEAVSCDEMYVDLTSLLSDIKMSPTDFVTHLRNEISTKTGCPCSAGVGENRLQARMATKKAKPNGQYFLSEEHVEKYFHDILISDLPGVGHSTTSKLNQLNWKTCLDLQQVPLSRIQQELGKKLGETLSKYCRGIDDKPLSYDQVRKSVSAEVNYGIRFTENEELDTFLKQLCTEVHNRLVEYRARGKTIALKYMVRAKDAPVETAKFMGHGFCDNITKSITLSTFTCDLDVITQNIFSIKNNLNVPPNELRGIGIQVSKLDTGGHGDDSVKSNVLRNMFERATERNKNRKRAPSTDVMEQMSSVLPAQVEIRKTKPIEKPADKIVNKRGLRKTKSFQFTTADRDIKQMFTNASTSRNKVYDMFEAIDVDVLAELPDDIREQVLKEQMFVQKKKATIAAQKTLTISENSTKTTVLNTSNLSNASSNDAHCSNNSTDQTDLSDSKHSATCSDTKSELDTSLTEPNILLASNWRQMLTEWLESTDQPIDYDIDVLSDYFTNLMTRQLLCEVYLRLRFLHRMLTTKNCRWHSVYYRILNLIQSHVAQLRGNNVKLHADNDFNCGECKNEFNCD